MGGTIHGTVSVLLCMPHMFVFVSSQVSDMEMWVALYMEQYLYYCVCLTCLCLEEKYNYTQEVTRHFIIIHIYIYIYTGVLKKSYFFLSQNVNYMS